MTAPNLSAFQAVLEAVLEARAKGVEAISTNQITRETDDQDCYPRGITVYLDRSDPKVASLRFLSKHLDWLSFSGKGLSIRPPEWPQFRLTEVTYLEAVAESLRAKGIKCYADVHWR